MELYLAIIASLTLIGVIVCIVCLRKLSRSSDSTPVAFKIKASKL